MRRWIWRQPWCVCSVVHLISPFHILLLVTPAPFRWRIFEASEAHGILQAMYACMFKVVSEPDDFLSTTWDWTWYPCVVGAHDPMRTVHCALWVGIYAFALSTFFCVVYTLTAQRIPCTDRTVSPIVFSGELFLATPIPACSNWPWL